MVRSVLIFLQVRQVELMKKNAVFGIISYSVFSAEFRTLSHLKILLRHFPGINAHLHQSRFQKEAGGCNYCHRILHSAKIRHSVDNEFMKSNSGRPESYFKLNILVGKHPNWIKLNL